MMPFLQIKNFLFYAETGEQNLLESWVPLVIQNQSQMISKEISKVCSYVVLFSRIGNFKESVRLSRLSR